MSAEVATKTFSVLPSTLLDKISGRGMNNAIYVCGRFLVRT